jgi:integrase
VTEQLSFDTFNRIERLTVREAEPIYQQLEGRFLKGHYQREYLLNFAASPYGPLPLEDVSTVDIKTYLAGRKIENPNLKGSSINRERGRIMRLFSAFYEWRRSGRVAGYDFSALRLPLENPCKGIPRTDETQFRRNVVIEPEDFQKFLDYAHPETRKIAVLALLTLLRRRDIELLSKDAWNRALDCLSGTQAKTGRPFNVPVTVTVKLLFAKGEQAHVVDFTGHRKRWQRACRESGVYFQLRDLRRTGATHLLLEGIDIVTVQRYLGHSKIGMTMAYLNPPAPLAKEAGRALEQKFVTLMKVPSVDFQEN